MFTFFSMWIIKITKSSNKKFCALLVNNERIMHKIIYDLEKVTESQPQPSVVNLLPPT